MVRRWNGWGEAAVDYPLTAQAAAFLEGQLGVGTPPTDATLADVLTHIPPGRLPAHAAVTLHPEARLRASFGQSLPDWLRLRFGCIGTVCDGVAHPESSGQVRELMEFARAAGARVLPYGGGTSVVGHLSPPSDGKPLLVLDLGRLSRLVHLDAQAGLATFGAGVAGPDLEAQLRARGWTLGHFPQSFEYSTLGGWIVTRSSGQQSLGYGRIEQLFAGGRIETPRGTLTLPTVPASAAGPDLRELVLGSEGRMGVLTEAIVRIRRLPEYESFHAAFFSGWEESEAAVRAIAQERVGLSMLRLSDPQETRTMLALAGHGRAVAWLERYLGWRGQGEGKCLLIYGVSGSAAACREARGRALGIIRRHGGVGVGTRMGERWRAKRFRAVYLRNTLWQRGYCVDTVETACDWPKVAAMRLGVAQAARRALESGGERGLVYAHLSHVYPQGASVYTTMVWRLASDFAGNLARWQGLKRAVSEAIVEGGGTISHQHGVGKDHAPWLAAEKGPIGMSTLAALFASVDPDGLMAQGNLLADAP